VSKTAPKLEGTALLRRHLFPPQADAPQGEDADEEARNAFVRGNGGG
jgi:hypothetical protein